MLSNLGNWARSEPVLLLSEPANSREQEASKAQGNRGHRARHVITAQGWHRFAFKYIIRSRPRATLGLFHADYSNLRRCEFYSFAPKSVLRTKYKLRDSQVKGTRREQQTSILKRRELISAFPRFVQNCKRTGLSGTVGKQCGKYKTTRRSQEQKG